MSADATPSLGRNVFLGMTTTSERLIQSDASWAHRAIVHLTRTDHTSKIVADNADPDLIWNRQPETGYWVLGSTTPVAVDIEVDGILTRILGYGQAGDALPPEVDARDVRDIIVRFRSDYDGDLMMIADASESSAKNWAVMVTTPEGSVDEPEPNLCNRVESYGYGSFQPGEVWWPVDPGRFGAIHVVLPELPDVRVRLR